MSQDDETYEHMDDGSCCHHHSEDRDPCSRESASVSGRACSAISGEACCAHEVHVTI